MSVCISEEIDYPLTSCYHLNGFKHTIDGHPYCREHGAMLAVDKFGQYRCPVCHIGYKHV